MSDTIIAASLRLDGQDASNSIKSFKTELKEANQELISASRNFGPVSEQALAAAKRVGELKNEIGDAQKLANTFNTDGSASIKAFGSAVQGLAGGFAALQGVMGLLGTESEETQKALLKVQSALAISQGIESIADAAKGFGNLAAIIEKNVVGAFSSLKNAIITTGIGALTVAIGYLIANWDKLKYSILGTTAAAEANQKVTEKAVEGYVKEKSAVDLLVGEIENENTTRKRKGEIIAELQKISPAYFGNLELEGDKVKNLVADYGQYIKAIQLAATVKAAQDLNAENEKALLLERIRLQQVLSDREGQAFAAALSGTSILEQQSKLIDISAQKQADLTAKSKPYLDIILKANQELSSLGGDPGVPPKIPDPSKLTGDLKKEQGIQETDLKAHYQRVLDAQVEFNENLRKQKEEQAKTDADKEAEEVAANDAAFQKTVDDENAIFDLKVKNDNDLSQHKRDVAETNKALEIAIHEDKMDRLALEADILNKGAELLGKNTVAGKVLAIASATINTYLAVTKALSSYPPPFNFVFAGLTALEGLKNIQQIVKVQVPGQSGGGSVPSIGSISPTAPLSPSAQVTNTVLPQNQINQIGNATVHAYTLQAEGASSNETISRLNRAARLGG